MFIYCSHNFQASYKLDVPSLCTDFQEHIELHFSLGWQAILKKLLAPHNARIAIALGANERTLLCYRITKNEKIYLCQKRVKIEGAHEKRLKICNVILI